MGISFESNPNFPYTNLSVPIFRVPCGLASFDLRAYFIHKANILIEIELYCDAFS